MKHSSEKAGRMRRVGHRLFAKPPAAALACTRCTERFPNASVGELIAHIQNGCEF